MTTLEQIISMLVAFCATAVIVTALIFFERYTGMEGEKIAIVFLIFVVVLQHVKVSWKRS